MRNLLLARVSVLIVGGEEFQDPEEQTGGLYC
jgi:hypothetical protein